MNRLLWLRCRLTQGMYSQSRATAFGGILAILASWLGGIPLAVLTVLFLLGQSPDRQVELLHVGFFVVWAGWVVFPILSHRVNDGFDASKLIPYPIHTRWILLGNLLGSFLDLSVFLLLPFCAALAWALSGGAGTLAYNLLMLFLLVGQTVAAAHLALFFLLGLMRSHKAFDMFVVLVSTVFVIGLVGFELSLVSSHTGGESWLAKEPSRFLAFFPPGIAVEGMAALRDGHTGEAVYGLALMVAVLVLTLVLSDHVVRKSLQGAYSGSRSRRSASGSARSRSPRLFLFLRRLLGRSSRAGLVLREGRLMLREPQYRLMFIIYWILLIMMAATMSQDKLASGERELFYPFLFVSLCFTFAAPVLNGLAIERKGLAFLLTSPMAPSVILMCKNLAFVALTGGNLLFSVAVVTLWEGLDPLRMLAMSFLLLSVLVLLAGLGNVCSVVAPFRLPSQGGVPKRRTGFGQVLLVTLASMVVMSLVMGLSVVAALLIALPLASKNWLLLAFTLWPGLLFVAGSYCLSTFLAGWLLEKRRERLLAEVVD